MLPSPLTSNRFRTSLVLSVLSTNDSRCVVLLLLVSTLAGVSLAGGISKVTPSSACKEVLIVSLGGSGVLSSAMVDILCEELILFVLLCWLSTWAFIDCVGYRSGAFSKKNGFNRLDPTSSKVRVI